MTNDLSVMLRSLFTCMGALVAIFEPTLPYILICTFIILCDCFSAWQLSRRVKAAHPERVSADGHKFTSSGFGRVMVTLLKSYALILFAFMVQMYIVPEALVDLTKVAAGAICFWQLWSILENESSCNGALWARVLQRILVDKTSRHFDVDLSELKGDEDGKV